MKLKLFTFPQYSDPLQSALRSWRGRDLRSLLSTTSSRLSGACWSAAVFDFLDGFAARLMRGFVAGRQGTRFAGRHDQFRSGARQHSLFDLCGDGRRRAVGLCRVHSGRLFGSAAGEVQSRRASGYRVHRTSHAGLRDVFRFGGVHHAAERCRWRLRSQLLSPPSFSRCC